MPLYEYQCEACDARFEIIQKFSDPPADTCRACGGGPVRRLVSSPAIQFKGTGWYVTDYSQKGKPAAGSQDGAKEGADAGKDKDAKPAAADASAAKSGESGGSSGAKSGESGGSSSTAPAATPAARTP